MKRHSITAVGICAFLIAAVPMYAKRPTFHPAAQKYRNLGMKPATGRSGVAALEMRALRGKSDVVVDVSTGQLDSTTPPAGNLEKVQIKIFDEDGTLKVTDNYKKATLSGSTGSFSYDWPARGQRVQVQANIGGIDPARTDVVTVEGPVVLRPDLAVMLPALPQSKVNLPVGITATVREHNGDVGARANCVLKVDGEVVDHANGIWVDAGDQVDCAFTHAFTTPGSKQLTVEVTDVIPGDFDTGDNSATAAIEILPAGTPLRYVLVAGDYDIEEVSTRRQHMEWLVPPSPLYASVFMDRTYDSRYTSRSAYYQAWLEVMEERRFPITIETSLRMDGAVLHTAAVTVTPTYFESDERHSMACGSEPEDSGVMISVCTGWDTHWETGERIEFTAASQQGGSGWTVFVSLETAHYWQEGSYDDTLWWSQYEATEAPTQWPRFGNEVEIAGAFTDADGSRAEVSGAVQLYPMGFTIGPDDQCEYYDTSNPDGTRETGYSCWTYVYTLTGKEGLVADVPWL